MNKTVLSDKEIEKGRQDIFSTENQFCPCDSRTMKKVARWVEQAVLQSPEIQALREDAGRMRNALNKIAAMNSMSYHSLETAKITAKAAMEPRK